MDPIMKKPSLFRRVVLGLVNGWRRVMDVRYNPLKYIPSNTNIFYVSAICCGRCRIFSTQPFRWFTQYCSKYYYTCCYTSRCSMQFVDAERDGKLVEGMAKQSRYKIVTQT